MEMKEKNLYKLGLDLSKMSFFVFTFRRGKEFYLKVKTFESGNTFDLWTVIFFLNGINECVG